MLLACLLSFGISYWIESKNAWSYEDEGTRGFFWIKKYQVISMCMKDGAVLGGEKFIRWNRKAIKNFIWSNLKEF